MDDRLQELIRTPEFEALPDTDRKLVVDQFFKNNYGDQLVNYTPEEQSLISNQFLKVNYPQGLQSEQPTVTDTAKLPFKGLTYGFLHLPESLATGFEYAGQRLGMDPLVDQAQEMKDYWQQKAEPYKPPPDIQGNIWDSPELLSNARWWLYNVPQMIPSLGASLVPGVVAGNVVRSAGLVAKYGPRALRLAQATGGLIGGGSLEAASTYNAVLQEGGSEQEAARSAEMMFFGAGILNAFGNIAVLHRAGTSFMSRVTNTLGAGVAEGLTEGAEEPWETFSRLVGKYLAGEELPEHIEPLFIQAAKEGLTVAPIAAVTGAGASLFGGQSEVLPPGDRDETPPTPPSRREDEAEYDRLIEESGNILSPEADAKADDIITKISEGEYQEPVDEDMPITEEDEDAEVVRGEERPTDIERGAGEGGEEAGGDLVQQAEEEEAEPTEDVPEAQEERTYELSQEEIADLKGHTVDINRFMPLKDYAEALREGLVGEQDEEGRIKIGEGDAAEVYQEIQDKKSVYEKFMACLES